MDWNRDAEWETQNLQGETPSTSTGFHLSILFLAAFAVTFFGVYSAGLLLFVSEIHEFWLRGIWVAVILLPTFSGCYIVAHFKLRNTFAIRCAAWPGGIGGALAALYAVYWSLTPLWTEVDHINFEALWPVIVFVIPLGCGVAAAEMPVMRSWYLFSEKTNQWLSSYTTRQRVLFAGPVQSLDDIAVEDVLGSEPAKKRKGSYSLTLFSTPFPIASTFSRYPHHSKPGK